MTVFDKMTLFCFLGAIIGLLFQILNRLEMINKAKTARSQGEEGEL